MRTAVLVDGGFFAKRASAFWDYNTPKELAGKLHWYCRKHLEQRYNGEINELYRIFYYDCLPIAKKMHNPISGKAIDFSKTNEFKWRSELHEELKSLRKVALRLGELDERNASWRISTNKLKELFKGEITWDDIGEDDVTIDAVQKGVDMRIGIDIASLAYKKQADQIVLIAGDSDFVPAAKLARREGVDFILDPMRRPIKKDLFEHIDGLRTPMRSKKDKNDTAGEGVTESE